MGIITVLVLRLLENHRGRGPKELGGSLPCSQGSPLPCHTCCLTSSTAFTLCLVTTYRRPLSHCDAVGGCKCAPGADGHSSTSRWCCFSPILLGRLGTPQGVCCSSRTRTTPVPPARMGRASDVATWPAELAQVTWQESLTVKPRSRRKCATAGTPRM